MTNLTPIIPKTEPGDKSGKLANPRILSAIPTFELLEEISERADIQEAFWRDVAALARVELARLELGKGDPRK